jgi:hypothetical protein
LFKATIMTTTTLRKKVHQYIDDIDNDLLEAVYNILKIYKHDDGEQSRLTKEQKSSLDKTLSEHKAGKLKYYTIEQAKAIINNK